jgi:glycosyltransferase involved in cell wall biosynthesis
VQVADFPRQIILVNRFFYPDHSPTSELLSDVAFMLARKGLAVKVLTSRLRYEGSTRLRAREQVQGVDVQRVWTSSRGQQSLIGRSIDYLTFYLSAGYSLWHLAGPADVIIVKTDPPLLSIIAAPIAKLKGARLINWLQDLFPEIAEAVRIGGGPATLLFRQLRCIRNWSLRAGEINVVPGLGMSERLRKEGIPAVRLKVIPNWSDGVLIKPDPAGVRELRQKWNLCGCFVVAYAGNLGRAHDVSTIIEAMTVLQNSAGASEAYDPAKNIMFLFVGGGAQRDLLEREISQRQLRNVVLQPYQSREALGATLAVGDIHLVSLKPELEGLVVPSKFYGIAAAGRPVLFIGAPDGEIARLVRDTRCGLTVQPGDAEGLVSQILKVARDPEIGRAMGARGRASFEQYWDKPRALQQWEQVLKTESVRASPD